MAKSHVLQNSFVSGELSPIVKGRTDLDQYYQGMETAENVVTVPQGGVKRRPGFEHITVPRSAGSRKTNTPTMPRGGTPANINDGNIATNTTTTTDVGTITDYVIAQYDLGSAQSIAYVDVLNIKSTTATSFVNLQIQYSSDNANWTGIDFLSVNDQEQNLRVYVGQSARYYRLVLAGANNAGTARIFLSEFNLLEFGVTSDATKLHAFEVGSEDSFLLIFSIGNCRIYKITDTSTEFTQDLKTDAMISSATLPKNVAVNENVALLFNENLAPRRIVFNKSTLANPPAQFSFDIPVFTNIPQFDFNDENSPTPTNEIQVMTLSHGSGHTWKEGDRFQIDIEGVLSKNISFAGDSNADQRNSTIFNIQKNLQEMPIFGETGIAVARTGTLQYTITISGESTRAFKLFSGFPTLGNGDNLVEFTKSQTGSPRSEDVWNAFRGYPKSGVFTAGRLWLGGTRDKPQSILASKAGSFLDFLVKEGDDDEGIFVTINGKNSEIVAISSDRGLQVFTEGSEYKVDGNTPGDISVVQQTQHGTRNTGANAIAALDGATMFLDRNGRSLRQYLYNFNEDAYRSVDMSVLASHLINDPKDIAVATSTSSEDASYVFILNGDGTGVLLNTLREQDIIGFTKIDQVRPNGQSSSFIRIASVNNRIVTLSAVDTFEFSVDIMNESYLMDHSVKFTSPHSTTEGGLLHLQYEQVQLVMGNSVLPSRTVSATGTITLTTAEAALTDTLEVGQNFIPKVKTMPINSRAANSSQNALRQKRVDRMNLRVHESAGVSIDGNLVPVRSFGDSGNSPLNSSLVPTTGIIEDNNGGNGWDREVAPVISVDGPTPFHLQAISYEVSSS